MPNGIRGNRWSFLPIKKLPAHPENQDITISSMDDRHIHLALEFLKPWKSKAKDNWLFEPWGDGETKVTWQNSGNLPWPMARLMGTIINKNLNHQFEVGLSNLKKLCEG